MKSEETTTKPDQSGLGLALERFRLAAEAEARIREDGLDDLRFRAGEQWPEQIAAQRKIEDRPCLTINRIPGFLRQVTNEQRQNKPAIQINPVDDAADPITAEILQGLVRHIEIASDADTAYDTAFEAAATSGFGYFRITADYCDPLSFDQDIRIERIRNAFTVYFDPTSQKSDYSDAQFAFIVSDLLEHEYKRQFPKSELAGLQEFASLGDRAALWLSGGNIRIAEYYFLDEVTAEICECADGQVRKVEDVERHQEQQAAAGLAIDPNLEIKRKRRAQIPVVKWQLLNGIEVLEERALPGYWIPIIPVLGDELDVNGVRHLIGIVRNAKDPQRMLNYWTSAQTEMIALAPRTPYIGAAGQFEGREAQWKNANTRSYPYLEYKPVAAANGSFAPPPSRQVFEPPILAISNAREQAADDLKATTGIYDASLGNQSNETSGKAILARQQEGDTANYHLIDNLSRAIKHAGRIILSWIPAYYDRPRIVRIVGADQEHQTVAVNQTGKFKGIEKVFDLTVGKYDVTVSVGPSYASKRQQAVEAMLDLVRSYPALFEIAGDLLVKNMDWPGAAKLAERLKRSLPMAAQDTDGQDGGAPDPAQLQAQLQAIGSQLEQAMAELQEAKGLLSTKKLELDSRERIAGIQANVTLALKAAELEQKDALEQLKAAQTSIRDVVSTALQERQQEHAEATQQQQLEAAAAAETPTAQAA